jgi:hypothetical protein
LFKLKWVMTMKGNMKAMAIIVCAFFVISPFTAMLGGAQTGSREVAVPKIVVGELFTGLWCGYCKYAEQAMDKIVDDKTVFDDRFVLVEWHNGDKYAIPEGTPRESYYAVSGFPTARFDGKDSSVGAGSAAAAEQTYRGKINARPQNADAYVEIDAHIAGTQLTVWVNITVVNAITLTNLVVHAITIQDEDIIDGGGQYPIRMTAVNHTINAQPTTIKNKGDVERLTKTVTVNATWDKAKLRVVAFLQSNTNKEVIQGNINYITSNAGFSKTSEIADASIAEDGVFTKDLKTVYSDPENDKIGNYTLTSTTMVGSITNSILTLTPPAEWSGQDSIYLVISDGMNFPIDYSFKVTVTPVNDAPRRTNGLPNVTMLEGTTKTDVFDMHNFFTDIDDTTLTYSYSGNVKVNVTLKPSGYVSFQAPIGFSGSETITFSATDAGALVASGDMKVTVTDVNFPPKLNKAIPDITMIEDAVDSSIKLSTYFSDIDSVLQYTISGQTDIQIQTGEDSTMTITPKADWAGAETITVSASDTINKAITDSFVITVTPVNDAPELTGTAFEKVKFNEDTDYTTEMSIKTLFTDIDNPSLTYSISSGDSDLEISLTDDYMISFHPAANWNGEKSYWIKATDGQYTVQYNATVKVEALNDPPTIDSYVPQSLQSNMNEGASLDFNIVATDVANEGEVLTYKWTSNNKDVGDNTAAYKFETDFTSTGTYTIVVTVSDGELSDTHTWTVKVKDVNRKPEVSIISPLATDTFRSDTPISFSASGTDADQDKISYQWSIDGVSLTPGQNASTLVAGGPHNVKVTASDGKGGFAEATMSITVKAIKKSQGSTGMGSTAIYAIVAVVAIAAVLGVLVALKMRKKKPEPSVPTSEVAPLPPPPPQGYAQQPTDPSAGYYSPQQQEYYPPPQ